MESHRSIDAKSPLLQLPDHLDGADWARAQIVQSSKTFGQNRGNPAPPPIHGARARIMPHRSQSCESPLIQLPLPPRWCGLARAQIVQSLLRKLSQLAFGQKQDKKYILEGCRSRQDSAHWKAAAHDKTPRTLNTSLIVFRNNNGATRASVLDHDLQNGLYAAIIVTPVSIVN